MTEFREIHPSDTKTIHHEDGTIEVVSVLIPECCREGWEDCPHVARRDERRSKKNIGL